MFHDIILLWNMKNAIIAIIKQSLVIKSLMAKSFKPVGSIFPTEICAK